MTHIRFYEGKGLDPTFNLNIPVDIDPYIPGPKLVEAVKLAQFLGRPLLVKGEPGCGKTRLAEAVAYDLFGDEYKDYYFEWHVKSSSKAQDGLYVINHLKRLRDANQHRGKQSLDITLGPGKTTSEYLELGPLGKAFMLTRSLKEDDLPPVVLIDEIDKADIDFPNDLLLELDQLKFEIPDTNDGSGNHITIEANKYKKPLIIITSNDEKPLPAAFLRRCLFRYIEYPTDKMLLQILNAKFPGLDQQLADKASKLFTTLRAEILNAGTAIKNISTSEFLDWVKVIAYYQKDIEQKQPDLDRVEHMAPLAKDLETVQIFMNFNESKNLTTEKVKTSEPTPTT
jgi:MoxR-like ATPase